MSGRWEEENFRIDARVQNFTHPPYDEITETCVVRKKWKFFGQCYLTEIEELYAKNTQYTILNSYFLVRFRPEFEEARTRNIFGGSVCWTIHFQLLRKSSSFLPLSNNIDTSYIHSPLKKYLYLDSVRDRAPYLKICTRARMRIRTPPRVQFFSQAWALSLSLSLFPKLKTDNNFVYVPGGLILVRPWGPPTPTMVWYAWVPGSA